MKEEMKETIQEDLNNFKAWGIINLVRLKKWWVRLILSGFIGRMIALFQNETNFFGRYRWRFEEEKFSLWGSL